MEVQSEQPDLNDQMKRRREELEALRKLGIETYPYSFNRTASSNEIIQSFKDDEPRRTVAVAGRIMSLRKMGKASFCRRAPHGRDRP